MPKEAAKTGVGPTKLVAIEQHFLIGPFIAGEGILFVKFSTKFMKQTGNEWLFDIDTSGNAR